MPQPPDVRPPVIAGWLVDLVTSSEQAEAIRGDLLEEFSALTSKSGVTCARRWYWRQSLKTIAHLVAIQFPVIAGTIMGGWILLSLVLLYTQIAVYDVLLKHGDQVYARMDAHLFWLIYAIWIELVIEPFLIGSIAAVAAKGKEVLVTLVISILFCCKGGFLPHILKYILPKDLHCYGFAPNLWTLVRSEHNFRRLWSTPNFGHTAILVTTFVSPVMIVIGGLIVRNIRSASPRRRSATT
jgi:hypothetical protein